MTKNEKFVASNSAEIEISPAGSLSIDRVTLFPRDFSIRATKALREFFLAERDEELGRWRSKRLPDYVVYPGRNDRLSTPHERSVIMNERNGTAAISVLLSAPGDWAGATRQVINEYNKAHPEPKPWHDAKPGEAWVITYGGEEHAMISDGAFFLWGAGSEQPVGDSRITAGRRIWPVAEASESD